jgi:excisionase family DNA binding protein
MVKELSFEQKELTIEQTPGYLLFLGGEIREIKKIVSETKKEVESPITIEQAARFTYKEVPTIYGLVHRRKIPFHKNGKRLYFFKSELVEWIKKHQPWIEPQGNI